jgi:hypothetical protein
LLGAIYLNLSSTITLSDTTFTSCKCDHYGGALRILSTTKITSCLFDRCVAGSQGSVAQGGAIHVDDTNLTIISCKFVSCNSLGGGGAIAFSVGSSESGAVDITLLLEKTVFLNCESTSGSGEDEKGGALRLYFSGATCQNCSFLNCRSNQGGGAIGHLSSSSSNVVSDPVLELDGCVFSSNYASTRGGAIEVMRVKVKINSCGFLHNGAGWYGGALASELYSMTITNTAWVRNFLVNCNSSSAFSSYRNGGAIFLLPKTRPSECNLTDCLFIKNTERNPCAISFFFFFLMIDKNILF